MYHMEKKTPFKAEGDSRSQKLQSLLRAFKSSEESSCSSLGLVSLRKAGWLIDPELHVAQCPEQALNSLNQFISRGLQMGDKSLQNLQAARLLSQVGRVRKKLVILEMCHLDYLAQTPLPLCLPTRESV